MSTSETTSSRPLILIGPTPPPIHGSAFATKHLIEAVKATGLFAAHLETGEDDRPVFNTGTFDLINVYLGLKHVLLLLAMLVRHRDADVHVPISQNRWGFARDGIFIWLASLARRNVIVHLYGGMFGDFYASRQGFERRAVKATFARVSEAWVETPNRLGIFSGLVPDRRIRVLENTCEDIGVGPKRDVAADRSLRLLFLANLIPEKGHGDLLAALEELAAAGIAGIDLRLIGEVEEREAESVRERAARLAEAGIEVELLSTVLGEAKVAQYRWADVFVLPSRYPPEGQPLVLLEAMSAGLPILSTDHSGIPHTVLDEQQGLIVAPGDIGALAAALRRLQGDPDLRARLGESGRARYEERYTKAAFAKRVAGLLAAPAAEISIGGAERIAAR